MYFYSLYNKCKSSNNNQMCRSIKTHYEMFNILHSYLIAIDQGF